MEREKNSERNRKKNEEESEREKNFGKKKNVKTYTTSNTAQYIYPQIFRDVCAERFAA